MSIPMSSMATSSKIEYAEARSYLDRISNINNSQTACLSILPHDLKDARDLRCHFFGCLGIKKRVDVLKKPDHPIWSQAEKLESQDTELHARLPKSEAQVPNQEKDDRKQLDMRYITALTLQADLKRITVLRATPALKGLVSEVSASVNAWRSKNKHYIQKIHDLRQDSQRWEDKTAETPRGNGISRSQTKVCKVSSQDPTLSTFDSRKELKELEQDLEEFSRTLQSITEKKPGEGNQQESDGDSESSSCSEPSHQSKSDGRMGIDIDESSQYDLRRDFKARLIKFKRPDASNMDASSFMADIMGPLEEDVANKIFKGSFPDQQVPVYHLMDKEFKRRMRHQDTGLESDQIQSWLEKDCPSELRYYHIPVNNMSWVEQAIASYFDETLPEPGGGFESCPQTRLVLQDWCWRGQERNGGPGSVVHTRNLRPICEKIPTDFEDLKRGGESTQKDLVLFMPFLHWETDRRRHQVANLIEQLADEHELEKRERTSMSKSKRIKDREGLERAAFPATRTSSYQEPNYYRPRSKHRDTILKELANMLWERVRTNADDVQPFDLALTLWQRIRDEDYSNELMIALKMVVCELSGPEKLPPELQLPAIKPIFFEDLESQPRLREWMDIVWAIKVAGKGMPAPHSLENIFWKKIKQTRQLADAGERQHLQDKVFRKKTTIFKGVQVDEYGHLQPENSLAKILVRAARLYEQMITYPDQRLIEEYLFKYPPLHPRRTLDQAYFWRLRDTRLRDRDQVVYRYTNAQFAHKLRLQPPSDVKNDRSRILTRGNQNTSHEQSDDSWEWARHGQYEDEVGCDQCDEDIRKTSRAIMVDQLWIWILDKDTILTCFPQRYGMYDNKDPSGVHQSIRLRVKTRSNPDNHIRSIYDLALIILDECFDTFFSKAKTADKRPQVMDMFAESIGRVTNKQAIAFKHLWQLSERLTGIYQSGIEDKVDPALILALLNVTPEAELQREIRDIIDELDIILHIAKQQNDMITRFVKLATQIIDADVDKYSRYQETSQEEQSDSKSAHHTTCKRLIQQQSAFKSHSEDLLSEIKDRIDELTGLKNSAESTAQNVNDLLGLKQQQASVVQAYEAMKQGEETVRQGKAIMVFTVMTIIFLPLSFMSSLFGMNAVELTGNDPSPGAGSSSSTNSSAGSSGAVPDEIVPFYPTTFKRQVLVMFTVSFGAVLLVIIPAFSPLIRAYHSTFINQFVTKIITWSGLYKIWLKRGVRSKDVRDHGRANVGKMKKNVREALARQILLESELWDGVRKSNSADHAGQRTEADHQGDAANREWVQGADGPRARDLEMG